MKTFFVQLTRIFASSRSFGVFLLMLLIAVRISDPSPVEELRLRSFDWFQTLQPRSGSAHFVTIVDIDEASLNAYGQWPWPRTLIADLLMQLYKLQRRAIGFDVVFAERERSSPS